MSKDLISIGLIERKRDIICSTFDLLDDSSARGVFSVDFFTGGPVWLDKEDKTFKMNGYSYVFEKETTWKDDYPEYSEYFAKQEKKISN